MTLKPLHEPLLNPEQARRFREIEEELKALGAAISPIDKYYFVAEGGFVIYQFAIQIRFAELL